MIQEKYPQNIIEIVRKRLGLTAEDTSMDNEILEMEKSLVFSHFVNWNGLLDGYDYITKSWVRDIYSVELDKEED